MNGRLPRVLKASLLAGVAFCGGAVTSAGVSAARSDGDDTYRNLAIFARVLNYVENNYVDAVEPESLVYGAIRGMLATLDPHSTFMAPDQYAALKSEAQGEFGGIGVEIELRSEGIIIVGRHTGGPAMKAGLQLGDRIVAVDEVSVSGQSLPEVVRRIKGPPGQPVAISVVRARTAATEVVEVRRERIRVTSVVGQRLEGAYGYLRIKTFTERTYHDMKSSLDAVSAAGPLKGLVLDMRDNPGGLLDEAVRVADTWLSDGVIVSTEGRTPKPEVELAHPKGTQPRYPIVVLVNGGTASAAEIVAGALQDHRRGVVLGTQTFGKGSVQTVIELEDRSALKLTIARYFTPAHRSIQGTGITPDIVVPVREAPTADKPDTGVTPALMDDNQVRAAVDVLRRSQRRR